MIELILKSYFSVLLAIGASCFSILALGLYTIYKQNKSRTDENQQAPVTNADISAIAGDDLFATQLDLARAFIESGRKQFAKTILESIAQDGNDEQKVEAKMLLDSSNK